jgi:exodeoxyribonuclease V beta subunit
MCDTSGATLPPITLWRHKPPPPSKGNTRITLKPIKRLYSQHIARHIHGVLHNPAHALWVEEGVEGEEGYTKRKINASDLLILVRENREAHEVAEALRELEIPFTLYKPEGLLQGNEAHEIYTLLKAIVDPHSKGARLKAFTTPFFGVPWSEVYHYNALPPGHHRLERLLQWHQLASQGRYGALFYQLLHHSGLAERELFFAESERELTNYQHIFEILLSVTAQHKCTPRELLTLLGRYMKGLEAPPGSEDNIHRLYSDRQMVQVMTIHKSKGLEAPVIYLFGGFGSPPDQVVNIIHDEQLGRRVLVGATARKVVAERLKREQGQEDQRLLYVALTRAQVKLYMPFIDTSRPLNGTYQPLKERLRAMRDEGFEAYEGDFELEELDRERPLLYAPTSDKTLSEWSPQGELFDVPDVTAQLKDVLHAQRPLVVTSYTRMKQIDGVHSLTDHSLTDHYAHEPSYDELPFSLRAEREAELELEGDQSAGEALGEASQPVTLPPEEAADELPGGREMGRCLHEIIEEVPLESLKRVKAPSAWLERVEVRVVFEEVARRHGVEQGWLPRLAELVFNVLKDKITSPEHNLKLPALSGLKHLIEMEFMYPIPEDHHPQLSALHPPRAPHADPEARWRVERGFVKGFIDFLCEHKGRMYVVDWKSDLCPAYTSETLTQHVDSHYTLQAQLYTLGVVRWLNIRDEESYEARFGGVMYLFLRAFREGREEGAGVYFNRPSWAEVQRYEELLSAALPAS